MPDQRCEPAGCSTSDPLGDVVGADRDIQRTSLGACAGAALCNSVADYDGDGCVTCGDYRIWYGYFKAAQ